uniref:Uncharacterized protein n=1 Tax=Aegilops tauschii subsp. strangulata TaxID=200361 RepID=A0A453LXD8_AEGTS
MLRGARGGSGDSRRVDAAEVARRRVGAAGACGRGGALSEWMAGVGALMVVAGCASVWASTQFRAYAPPVPEGTLARPQLKPLYEEQG